MTRALVATVEARKDFNSIRNDPILLLNAIDEIGQETIDSKDPVMACIDTLSRLLQLKQQDGEDLTIYTGRMKHQGDLVKTTMGDEYLHGFVLKSKEYKEAAGNTVKKGELKKAIHEKFVARMLLRNSDRAKYGSLINNMAQSYAFGNKNSYPDTLQGMMEVLDQHRWDKTYSEKKRNNNNNSNKKDNEQ